MPADLSVVIPAFNERNAIGAVLAELRTTLDTHGISAEVLVVDDGSQDGTANEALKAGARVVQHRNQRGYGAALKTGIVAATCDTIAIVDADGTYPLDRLAEMLGELTNADMVVGARTGNSVHVPLIRRPAKWVLNRVANYVSASSIPDLNSGFRVFRRDVVLQYFPILPDLFSWTTTITLAMHCDNYTLRYIPIDYRQRSGKSKIVPWDAGSFAILILRTAMLFKPLRVFLPIVGLCLAYGMVKVVVDLAVIGDRMISASAILMLISALVILLIGMLGDAMSTRLGRLSPNAVAGVKPRGAIELTAGSAADDDSPRGASNGPAA